MLEYIKTHPWINFTLDLRKANYELWLALGEAQSKCEHIAGIPMSINLAEKLHKIYLAKGVLATTAIEGNTLTEEEVRLQIEGELRLPPSKEYLAQEVQNIIDACNKIKNSLLEGQTAELSVPKIKEYNALVLRNLELEEGVVPGEIRNRSVVVGNYRAAPAKECEFLLEKFCRWLNEDFPLPEEHRIAFHIIKAIAAHLYLVWIHPFDDGNGRTARLIELQILLSAGIPTPAAHLLSNHYNQTRRQYYLELSRASKSGGNILNFIEYAVNGFKDSLKEQLKSIRLEQWDISWRDYIYDIFQGKTNRSDIRLYHLILDLSEQRYTVPISEIRHISPRIAEAYATKTDRTLERDIKKLLDMQLIVQTDKGILANKQIILAFLPARKKGD